MNYENLRKFLNELTDIVYRERKMVGYFILLAIALKSIFYFLTKTDSSLSEKLTVIEIPRESSGFSNSTYEHTAEIDISKIQHPLFPFDPATASFEDLIKLGFPPKTANILINYRTKGGRFFKKEDVKKIYGVTPALYAEIEPYISIAKDNNFSNSPNQSWEKKSLTPSIIDINTASIEQWKALPNIGDYYANKFVKTREGLGAFVSIDQIKETYGLADSTFQKIKPFLKISKGTIKKININDASIDEIRNHPYILKWQADDILKHRPIYGLDDLFELYTFREKEKYKWIETYFEF